MNLSRFILPIILLLLLISYFIDYNSILRNLVYVIILVYPIKEIISKPVKNFDKPSFYLIAYTIFSLLMVVVQSLIDGEFLFHLVGCLFLNSYLYYWHLSSESKKNQFNYSYFLWTLNFFYLIIGILGIVQFHFSRDLYGFETSETVLRIKDLDYIRFRITSITGSPQVFGLSMVLIGILNLDRYLKQKVFINLIVSIFFLFAALYSQNKSVGVLFSIYLISFFVLNRKKYKTIIPFFVTAFVTVLFNVQLFLELFFRFESLDRLIEAERTGRINIYSEIFEDTNIIIGQGWGSFNNTVTKLFNLDYQNPESFLLQLYGEAGIIALFLFIVYLLANLYKTSKDDWPIVLCFIIQFFFVHAALSPFIFPLYSMIFIRNLSQKSNTQSKFV